MKAVFEHAGEVAVLDGGLPRWQELGYPVETGPPEVDPPAPTAVWKRVQDRSWDLGRVQANIDRREALVVDARPKARFEGSVDEPRPNSAKGHIPGSRNVPFIELLAKGHLRPDPELRERLLGAGVPLDKLAAPGGGTVVASCGSGLTACIVGLAMHRLGMPLGNFAVYDGSWAEWGTAEGVPVDTGAAEEAPPTSQL